MIVDFGEFMRSTAEAAKVSSETGADYLTALRAVNRSKEKAYEDAAKQREKVLREQKALARQLMAGMQTPVM